MITVKNLSVSYFDKKVLEDINLEYDKPTIVGIIGPNGAGKSTLIKSILGLIRKDSGEITWKNNDLKKREVAYLPQISQIDWDFPLSVLDIVCMGLYPKIRLGRKVSKETITQAKNVLKKVQMYEYRNTQISQLSGGQQQRVFMARALIQQPRILFLDEPFVGIDITTEQLLIKILKQLKKDGVLIFIVHHDLSKVEEYFEDVIILNKEVIASGQVKDVFKKETLTRAFVNPIFDWGLL